MRTRSISFVKAEANGNDFALIAASAVPANRRAALARALCDRHRGIGADGVEFYRWDGAVLHLDLFNADGSPAEISGNGSRCAAAWCAREHQARRFLVRTGAGDKAAVVLAAPGPRRNAFWIELAMGRPRFASDEIPMCLPEGSRAAVRDYPLEVAGERVRVTALSMGNPQCCVLVERFPAHWRELAAALESHSAFPQRANVAFVRPLGPHEVEARFFERGAGVTESSGTGSCAAAVAAIVAGRAASPVRVRTPGGEQQVAWARGEARGKVRDGIRGGVRAEVRLRGPARLVARGVFAPPALAGGTAF